MNSVSATGVTASAYLLVIQGPDWYVGFQEAPEKKLVVRGRRPTLEELFEELFDACLGMDVLIVKLVWWMVEDAEVTP